MNIIIVGCGKVGYTLVEQLGGENHNITVIDTNEEKVNSITDDLDAMGIVGNGVSFQTLSEAGIDHANLLIAVGVCRIFFLSDTPQAYDGMLPWLALLLVCSLFFPLLSVYRFKQGCQD